MNMTVKPIYIRIGDARAIFGIGRSAIYEMSKRGEITIHKRGTTSLLKVADVERAIEGPKSSSA